MMPRTAPACPKCGTAMVLMNTMKYRYGSGYVRRFWACPRYPACRSTCGAHPDGRPSSTPADEATRLARVRAHAAFDELWMSGAMSRTAAYRWMQRAMDLTVEAAHIGRMDAAQCTRLIGLVGGREAASGRVDYENRR
jgi:hypothetical protein